MVNYTEIGQNLFNGLNVISHKLLQWGDCWHFSCEYPVNNLLSEVGFFTEALGFTVNALSHDHAMVKTYDDSVFISFRKKVMNSEGVGIPKLTFMITTFDKVLLHLDKLLHPYDIIVDPSGMRVCKFFTPNNAPIEIWELPK